ncbi:uncharacterized protein TRIREDRAFT_107141, partial [Trichoderma reesei QM6a]
RRREFDASRTDKWPDPWQAMGINASRPACSPIVPIQSFAIQPPRKVTSEEIEDEPAEAQQVQSQGGEEKKKKKKEPPYRQGSGTAKQHGMSDMIDLPAQ